ncbi:hypothetical protein CROQUDRAFT_669974 [Cronartium quercuum f. sp. fusiforme G11]|uniref:ABC transporter n=1 Tax=Cronartium quercuum f. sp. fusiforme G11 TaxID=708437 RepID=A0A9P6TDZ9_9BASI|nr:hypothetical protein CROQUDRAFT_669974 [Cronartium quercuum f. sp. fusiforme G11]
MDQTGPFTPQLIPETNANWFSIITFHWIHPLLALGYKRTLVQEDLWSLPEEQSAHVLSELLMKNYQRRIDRAKAHNTQFANQTHQPWRLRWSKFRSSVPFSGRPDNIQTASLAGAISDTFFIRFWTAGLFKVISDGLAVSSPFVTKALIQYGAQVYASNRSGGLTPKPSAGRGYALAFGLFLMQVVSSLCMHQYFYRSMSVGVLARAALITSIYRRALSLNSKSRRDITTAQLIGHISTDVSRIDFCLGFFHLSWTATIQLCAIIAILLVQIGVSSLAGLAIMIFLLPVQMKAMQAMFSLRVKVMKFTDERTKKIQEVLSGMKILKLFAWESPYLAFIHRARTSELSILRWLLIVRAGTMALAMSLPLLGSVLAFITYAATGHGSGNAGAVFTSLTLFNLLRMPLLMLPVSLGTITDASNACKRLEKVLNAAVVEDDVRYMVDDKMSSAIIVEGASWKWDSTPENSSNSDSKPKGADTTKEKASADPIKKKLAPENTLRPRSLAVIRRWVQRRRDRKIVIKTIASPPPPERHPSLFEKPLPSDSTSSSPDESAPFADDSTPFTLSDIYLNIPRGSLTAIVGPVGSGKSSLLQALIGEMKQTAGRNARFGGSIGYCPQSAWIQNDTIRGNILFGLPYEEKKYKRVIAAACLEADLKIFPQHDLTSIGERGINISGGQKLRLNIARALYFDPDIALFDDPLSAVDSHVGNHLFEQAIRSNTARTRTEPQTRVLVTHALHLLPKVDHIICLDRGRITETGNFEELIAAKGVFYELVRDFGGGEAEEKPTEPQFGTEKRTEPIEKAGEEKNVGSTKAIVSHMQEEEKATGSVGLEVYSKYLRAGNGRTMLPLLLCSMLLQQASTVLSSYWLVWWQEDHFRQTEAFYMGIYAALGIAQTFFSFLMGACSVSIGFYASKNMHFGAFQSVLRAPLSFLDTTPLGRVLSRFSKDIDTIDNTLNDSIRMALSTFSTVFGSIILIAIVSQWFLIAVGGILVLYFMAAMYYRPSARDFKRLDNLLRSALYAHFNESLTGITTIRAYGMSAEFLKRNCQLVDYENRAYLLTVINQRWLGIRLDALGSVLVLIVAIIGVVQANSLNPSQTGLILSYILSIAQSFSWMVRQVAEVENDFNSVERLIHYEENLEQEAPAILPATDPDKSWPSQGQISASKLVMAYRPGLPPVLKGVSFEITSGQKVAIVGRTGAGKSSIMMALFRIVELESGMISIDGVDIRKIGLDRLRKALAIIPQEALLFQGTIRSNLDPFGEYDDARLWDALNRTGLNGPSESTQAPTISNSTRNEGVDAEETLNGVEELRVDELGIDHLNAKKSLEMSNQLKIGALDAVDNAGEATMVIKPKVRYTLDSPVDEEGANLSVGERSLVSLARALVKDSRIILLDEATALSMCAFRGTLYLICTIVE